MTVSRGLRVELTTIGDGRLVITSGDDETAIGFIEYRVKDPADGWLTIGDIELVEGQRGWGYGSEAVRLLEGMAVEQGLGERFRADVDIRNGLGLYFWLRLGYRPADEQSDSPETLTLVRTS